MNQIINMVMKILMRKVVSKGIDAGFNKASSMRGGRKQPQPRGDIDDYSNPVRSGPTKEEVRAASRAKRQQNNGQA